MVQATVWVTNTRTGEHRNLTPNWGSSWAPRWSPDGARLAFSQTRRVNLTYSSGIVRLKRYRSLHRQLFVRSLALKCLNGHQMDVSFLSDPFLQQMFQSSMNLCKTNPQVLPKVSQETSFVEVYESENGATSRRAT